MGGLDVIRIGTSRGQGQLREDLSEVSPSAKVRSDGKKSHRRLGLRASWHYVTKPKGTSGQSKCGGCAPKARFGKPGSASQCSKPLASEVSDSPRLRPSSCARFAIQLLSRSFALLFWRLREPGSSPITQRGRPTTRTSESTRSAGKAISPGDRQQTCTRKTARSARRSAPWRARTAATSAVRNSAR